MEQVVQKQILTLNEEISKTNICDFWIKDMDSCNLILAGSFDFGYYTEIEIIFSEVKYISCPGGIFSINKFRNALEEEKNELIKRKVFGNESANPNCNIIIFEDDDEEAKYHIVFEKMDYKWVSKKRFNNH